LIAVCTIESGIGVLEHTVLRRRGHFLLYKIQWNEVERANVGSSAVRSAMGERTAESKMKLAFQKQFISLLKEFSTSLARARDVLIYSNNNLVVKG
jgi:hypothetical protein